MIPERTKTLIAHFPLGIVATVTEGGAPAASPKGTFLVLDDRRIAFGDIRSPGTLANLRGDARTEVVFIDPFARIGARIAGTARVIEAGTAEFDGLITRWQAAWGALADRIRALVVIEADSVKPLTTPPYDDGATEEDMIAFYKAKYTEIYP